MAPDYVFRPMSRRRPPLIRRWLETPDVVRMVGTIRTNNIAW